jgi:hypothetical protein
VLAVPCEEVFDLVNGSDSDVERIWESFLRQKSLGENISGEGNSLIRD